MHRFQQKPQCLSFPFFPFFLSLFFFPSLLLTSFPPKQEDKSHIIVKRKDLAGLPDDFISSLTVVKKEEDDAESELEVTCKYPHAFPTLKQCSVEETRKKMEFAFANRGKEVFFFFFCFFPFPFLPFSSLPSLSQLHHPNRSTPKLPRKSLLSGTRAPKFLVTTPGLIIFWRSGWPRIPEKLSTFMMSWCPRFFSFLFFSFLFSFLFLFLPFSSSSPNTFNLLLSLSPSSPSLLSTLTKLETKAKDELQVLVDLKKADFQENPDQFDGKINGWDLGYYSTKLLREKYGFDDEAVKHYFPTPRGFFLFLFLFFLSLFVLFLFFPLLWGNLFSCLISPFYFLFFFFFSCRENL